MAVMFAWNRIDGIKHPISHRCRQENQPESHEDAQHYCESQKAAVVT